MNNGGSGRCGGQEPGFGGEQDGAERLGAAGGEEGLAVGGVLEDFAENGDDLKVAHGIILRRAENEEEPDILIAVLERDAARTAPDGEHEVGDVLGAGMGKGDLVAEASGVEPVAGEELVVESLVVGHVRMTVEQARDLVQRCGALAGLDRKENAGGIEDFA